MALVLCPIAYCEPMQSIQTAMFHPPGSSTTLKGGGGETVAMGPREQALALRASMKSTHKPIMHR